MNAVEALRRCPLFKDFTDTGLNIFASICQEKVIPAGSPIFVENMVGESLFIVTSGSVKLTQREGAGEREVGQVGPGESLGELALLAKSVRLVSAVATTECQVIEIAQRDYFKKSPEKPQACLKLSLAIAAELARRVHETRDALREAVARPRAGPSS